MLMLGMAKARRYVLPAAGWTDSLLGVVMVSVGGGGEGPRPF
jgi:hypothetical protein